MLKYLVILSVLICLSVPVIVYASCKTLYIDGKMIICCSDMGGNNWTCF